MVLLNIPLKRKRFSEFGFGFFALLVLVIVFLFTDSSSKNYFLRPVFDGLKGFRNGYCCQFPPSPIPELSPSIDKNQPREAVFEMGYEGNENGRVVGETNEFNVPQCDKIFRDNGLAKAPTSAQLRNVFGVEGPMYENPEILGSNANGTVTEMTQLGNMSQDIKNVSLTTKPDHSAKDENTQPRAGNGTEKAKSPSHEKIDEKMLVSGYDTESECIIEGYSKCEPVIHVQEYNCSFDFMFSPFLVQVSMFRGSNGTLETLRLDKMDRAKNYAHADIIVFNTGHWWTHEKTTKGENYYREGDHVYPWLEADEAYRKALTTWARWIDKHINPKRTLIFFRGYSETHFRGGQWNSGGKCHREIEPIFKESYLKDYPTKMKALEDVLRQMRTPAIFLNVTRLTEYRKDGHPSIYRKRLATGKQREPAEQLQDCSHWCLPGIPDAWNALLYAYLLKHLKRR
ncbi:hypothetical protein Droror1_Dr00018621 [Drosera rotundifolia]